MTISVDVPDPLARPIRRDAVFSGDLRHRFELSRIWDESKGLVLFVGLNPSKAGRDFDDMTVAKGIGFARRWGFGGTLHGNAFSRVTTYPWELAELVEKVDAYANESALLRMAARARLVVFAWGAFPAYRKAFARVGTVLLRSAPECLGLTTGGFPRHISRLAYATPRIPF